MRKQAFIVGLLVGLAGDSVVASSAAAEDPGPNAPVQYDVSFENARHHEARITLTLRGVSNGPLQLEMARSSPGRYSLHDFANNVSLVSAVDGAGRVLQITRTEPSSWVVSSDDGTVRVSYTLFADRGDGTYAQIDAEHAHLNMPAVFMWAAGYQQRPIRVRFHPLDPAWKVATQLPSSGEANVFWAPNFKYFMDSPTELSDFKLREWTVTDQGRTYTFRLALHDPGEEADADVFAEKLKRLIPQDVAVFGELPRLDYGTYTFIADYMPQDTFDGMEHRNSTILTGTRSLQRSHFGQLGGASHELFHAWNVKRLRPAELEPFDFTRANPTPSLWLAEGFTNYYGPLMVRRSGQSTVDEFLSSFSGDLSYLVVGPGRAYGSPQEMSLRAPFADGATPIDRTNPYAFTSYYSYGCVLALALDLELRQRFKDVTLDDYMRALWRAYGVTERPYRPRDLRETLVVVTGDRSFAERFFDASVQGSALPDFEPLLAQAGLKLRRKAPDRAWLGIERVRSDGPEVLLDETPWPGSPLYVAGLDRGDRIVRLGQFPLASDADWKDALDRIKPGQKLTVRFVQRGREQETALTVGSDPTLEIVRFETAGVNPTAAQLAFRDRWLGPADPEGVKLGSGLP